MTARPDLLTPPGLAALLQALRAAGLPMGTREVLGLHHVFALRPGLGQDRAEEDQLRDLLASALTHDPDERELFDQIYRPWAERWADWARPAERREIDDPAAPFAPVPAGEETRPWWQPKLKVVARLAATALVALAVLRLAVPPDRTATESPDGAGGTDGTTATTAVLGIHTLWLPPPDAPIEAPPRIWRPSWPPLIFGVLALLAGGGLFWHYGREPWMPTMRPEPLPGPAKLPLLPLAESGPELLDADGARTLIWGVGRHLSEDLTHELELEASVRETAAAGGMPELRFAPEKRLREVWLWLDATAGDQMMERWADEIAQSLTAAGLPARIGAFDGDPTVLRWDEGQLFRPQEVEAHRQTALVAVCTDGAVLRGELAGGAGPRGLLRSLAAWPRLACVDFSTGGGLADVLRPLGIACVAPAELPAFFGLGGAPAPRREPEPDAGEIRAWGAALAFGGRPVDRATAWAVQRELGIEVSRWDFHLLHAGRPAEDAAVPKRHGGRMTWSGEGRSALVAWLAESSLDEPTGLRPGSLLAKSLDYWDRRLAEEAAVRRQRGSLDPWQERPAERHLAMERALLRLWREPAETAEELFELASGELREEIRQRLGTLAPRDCRAPEDGRVPLPWRFEQDLDDRCRWLLAELGLGGVARGDLRRPGRLGLALGVLAGLGLALVVLALAKPPLPQPAQATAVAAQVADAAPGDGWGPMRFVSLKGAAFRMGSEDGDLLAVPDEQPAHEVKVGEFWIGETEVTYVQYRVFDPEHGGEDDKPAVGVSWFEARDYCRSLGEDYDLPTEAEWEYAARAGTSTPWSFGANQALVGDFAWYEGNSGRRAHEVGLKESNPWGLYDMHGNVWEWVLDCYEGYADPASDQPIDDPGLLSDNCQEGDRSPAASRVLRGGSFIVGPGLLRSARRNWLQPGDSLGLFGFRCVRRPRRQLDPSSP